MPTINTTNANKRFVVFDNAGKVITDFDSASVMWGHGQNKVLKHGIEIRLLSEDLMDDVDESKGKRPQKKKERVSSRLARDAKETLKEEDREEESSEDETDIDDMGEDASTEFTDSGEEEENGNGESVRHMPGRRDRRAEQVSGSTEEEMETLEDSDHQQRNNFKHEDVDMVDIPGEEESRSNMELPFRPGSAF